jgi:type IV secretory pathway VirB4 component
MPSTQDFLQFDYIRDDVIVLKSGDVRAILSVPSINFGLKSQEEQDALVYAFQNFLNSLDFDLQIVIHSQRININPYLEDLAERAQTQENELLRSQTLEYIEFIRSFVSETNVMTKSFYVVVPFSLVKAKQKTSGIFSATATLLGQRGAAVSARLSDAEFNTIRTQLLQRVEFVIENLAQLNLSARMLKTAEIVEFLWRLYNPEQREVGGMPEVPPEAFTVR